MEVPFFDRCGDNAFVSSSADAGARLREVQEADLARLPTIERAAGALFREIGMDAVADDEVPSADELRPYMVAGRAWVAVDDADAPVGYLIADVVDGGAHIEQVSVLPAWSRRGVGRALIERALMWAKEEGFDAVTLTTFTEVAWNGPYYEHLGFRYLKPHEVGDDLARIRAEEARKGLDAWPRACMVRVL